MKIANITGYKFTPIEDELHLKETILRRSINLNLKGTVLISSKGLNFSVSGTKNNLDKFIFFIHSDSRFADVDVKITYNEYQPFRKMLVRIKKEIISMGIEEINPYQFTGQKISPKELKDKLDKKEENVHLYPRQEYEERLGTFKNALDLDLDSFRDFPEEIEKLRDDLNCKENIML